jgi:hypothetical protein
VSTTSVGALTHHEKSRCAGRNESATLLASASAMGERLRGRHDWMRRLEQQQVRRRSDEHVAEKEEESLRTSTDVSELRSRDHVDMRRKSRSNAGVRSAPHRRRRAARVGRIRQG